MCAACRAMCEGVGTPGACRRIALGIAVAVQLALLAAAQIDLLRRPAAAVRGPKWAWRVATLVNFAGPIAYFAFGRRAHEAPAAEAPAGETD